MKRIQSDLCRASVYLKYDECCAYCGQMIDYDQMEVDHMIPQSGYVDHLNAGTVPDRLQHLTLDDLDHIDNLYPSCADCNRFKGNNPLAVFRSRLQNQAKRAKELSAHARRALRYGLLEETEGSVIFYFEMIESQDKGLLAYQPSTSSHDDLL